MKTPDDPYGYGNLIKKATPHKRLLPFIVDAKGVYLGRDAAGEHYDITLCGDGKVVFRGHQTRIEFKFIEEVTLKELKKRLSRFGYEFQKIT